MQHEISYYIMQYQFDRALRTAFLFFGYPILEAEQVWLIQAWHSSGFAFGLQSKAMLDSVILDGTKFDNAILGSAMFDSAMQCCTTLSLNAQICGFHICKLQPCDLKQCFMLECSAYNWVLFWQMQYKGKIVTFQHFNVIPKVILIKLQIAGRVAGASSHFVRTRSVHEGLLATAHRDLARSSGQTNTEIQIYKDTKTCA